MGRDFKTTGVVRAHAKWVRSSARKARLVLDHLPGLTVPQAKAALEFSPRNVARDIELVLRSAAHNAEINHGLDSSRMVVQSAFADEGVTMKRHRPRARGRASAIHKRTSHITILLAPLEGAERAVTAPVEEPAAPVEEPTAAATTEESVTAGDAVVEAAVVEEKPKKSRAPRKPAAAKAEPEAADAEAAPKPRRRKAAAPTAEAAEQETAAPAEEKPARKPRTRKPKEEDA